MMWIWTKQIYDANHCESGPQKMWCESSWIRTPKKKVHMFFIITPFDVEINDPHQAPKENSRRAWSPGSIGSTYVDVGRGIHGVVMKKRWDIHGYQWNIGHFFCHWNIEMRIWWLTETIISLFWMKTIYPSLSHQLGLGSCQRETVLTCGLFLERTVSETTTNHGDICDLSWLVW